MRVRREYRVLNRHSQAVSRETYRIAAQGRRQQSLPGQYAVSSRSEAFILLEPRALESHRPLEEELRSHPRPPPRTPNERHVVVSDTTNLVARRLERSAGDAWSSAWAIGEAPSLPAVWWTKHANGSTSDIHPMFQGRPALPARELGGARGVCLSLRENESECSEANSRRESS